jgi:hypothetical protein
LGSRPLYKKVLQGTLDFRVDDLVVGTTFLSEHEIFFKLFVEVIRTILIVYHPS